MSKLLFIGCNHLQLEYLQAASGFGFQVLATDQNPQAPGVSLADEFKVVGYLDHDGLVAAANEFGLQEADAVFTASAHFAYAGAAQVAGRLGIRFPAVGTIDQCLDKTKFYEVLKCNNIPVPPTRIWRDGLQLDPEKHYYFKSDYGKTPKYCSRINKTVPPLPDHDLYYRHNFLLQEEIVGQHYRCNIYGDQMAVFVTTGELSYRPLQELPQYHETIKRSLLDLLEFMGLAGWLIKFDVLLDDSGWYVIDLGLDPPMRLRQLCNYRGIDFPAAYVSQYLLGETDALPPWSELFTQVEIQGTTTTGFKFLDLGELR